MHNDRLLINTVPKENVSEGYSKIAPTVFFLTLAYVDREGKVVVRENPGFDNEDPTDDGRYGLVFLENFEYHIKHWSSSGIAFYPETTLPYLGDPYEVRLPIAVEDEEGQKYQADLPLSVVGEGPRRIYGDDTREKELALLQKDMQIFGLDGNPELMGMVRAARRGNCSFEELRNLRFRLVEAAVNFYWEERGAEDRMSDLFTRYIVVAGTLVKAGDLAVEYVLKYYFVGYGYIVAKFSNPLKNMLCTYVGELSANGNLDQAPDFIKTVLKSSEEALSAAITGLFWGDDLKGSMDLKVILSKSTYMNITKPPVTEQIQETLGYVIAAYLLTCFARHYTYGKEGEKGDVYRSVIAAFQDLGLASLKAWFLDFVSKHCVSLFGKIGEACGKLYKQAVQKKLNEAAQEAGWKAFQGSVRKAFQSNPDELSRAALEAARQARSGASESLKKSVNETLDEGIRELSKAGEIFGAGVKDVSDSKSGGVLLTYLVSSMRDGKEVAGSDVKEVLYELVKEWLGVQANKIYEYVVPAETRDAISDVGLRVENGKIILTLLGYCVEINILENIAALTDLMFETLFSWMETLWEAMKTTLRWDDTPADLRDKVEKNPELIGQGLENTKQRIEANQWQYNGYERKTK